MEKQEFEAIDLPDVSGVAAGSPDLPPLILLHGWGGCGMVWRSTLRRLSGMRRIVALDLPGSGRTPPLGLCTVDAMAAWVLGVATRLGFERFALAGHSMGGNIASHAAVMAPDRITHLCLVNAAIYSDEITSSNIYLDPRLGPPTMDIARISCRFLTAFSKALPDQEKGDFFRPWLRRCGYVWSQNQSRDMIDQLRALVDSPFDPAQLPLTLPVLIVQGERDPVVPASHTNRVHAILADRIQHGGKVEMQSFPGFHVPMDDHPNEFAATLAAFLSDHHPG